MRVYAYVDGFNLYYGALKAHPRLRWLDVRALAARLSPGDRVRRVRYFTARVKGHGAMPQGVYLRALATLDGVSIHEGSFLVHTVAREVARVPHPGMRSVLEYRSVDGAWLSLPTPAPGHRLRASVRQAEEKGSDVNLATRLLTDAFRGEFETALVFSGDSDLSEPIRVVNRELGLPVRVVNPHPGRPSRELQAVARSYHTLSTADVAACALPDELRDARGRVITKPARW